MDFSLLDLALACLFVWGFERMVKALRQRPPKPKPHPVVIVSVMLQDANKLLLGQRIGKSAQNTGRVLSTPGGKVDFQETLIKAAQRELLEETGLLVPLEEFNVLGFKEHPQRYGGHFVTFYVTARYSEATGELTNREPDKCAGWFWAGLDEFDHDQCTEPKDVLAYWQTFWRANA